VGYCEAGPEPEPEGGAGSVEHGSPLCAGEGKSARESGIERAHEQLESDQAADATNAATVMS
jgi:hypothetical protein